MEDYNMALQQRLNYLEYLIRTADKVIDSAPEGTLIAHTGRTSYQYYHRKNAQDTHGIYIPKKKIATAKKLANKDYWARIKEAALEEHAILMEAQIQINSFSNRAEDVFMKLPNTRQNLLTPIWYTDEEFKEIWQAVEYEHKPFAPNDPEHYTDKKERVRSKSEALIANALTRHGIPYRYEYPVRIDRFTTLHPDFYCLNVKKRKEVIWEHFGSMDDSGYVNRNIFRPEEYEGLGYRLGETLIFTFETLERPLNTRTIEKRIENYLL